MAFEEARSTMSEIRIKAVGSRSGSIGKPIARRAILSIFTETGPRFCVEKGV
jgi:hypothetical protein